MVLTNNNNISNKLWQKYNCLCQNNAVHEHEAKMNMHVLWLDSVNRNIQSVLVTRFLENLFLSFVLMFNETNHAKLATTFYIYIIG